MSFDRKKIEHKMNKADEASTNKENHLGGGY